MLGYRDFVAVLRELALEKDQAVLARASVRSFGALDGGAQTIVGALLATCGSVLMPAFTYQTMVTPAVGPPDNALQYQSTPDLSVEFFHPQLAVHPSMGEIAETFRRHPRAARSSHPIFSFSGVNAAEALAAQELDNPWAPIEFLADIDGFLLLIGVNHRDNIALHYVEQTARRRQFIRWALTPGGVVSCPGFPGCRDGFQAIAPRLDGVARRVQLGDAWIEAVPLRDLVHIGRSWIREDPEALLCHRQDCLSCATVRRASAASGWQPAGL